MDQDNKSWWTRTITQWTTRTMTEGRRPGTRAACQPWQFTSMEFYLLFTSHTAAGWVPVRSEWLGGPSEAMRIHAPPSLLKVAQYATFACNTKMHVMCTILINHIYVRYFHNIRKNPKKFRKKHFLKNCLISFFKYSFFLIFIFLNIYIYYYSKSYNVSQIKVKSFILTWRKGS